VRFSVHTGMKVAGGEIASEFIDNVLQKRSFAIIVGNITTIVEISMEEAVSAADANRKFSLILRSVREGHSYVVTSHGRPVARIIPAERRENVVTGARNALLSRLERQSVVNAGRWTRDELYEDDRR
jgi:prevent-host-death family protein